MLSHFAGALALVCIWSTTALGIKWSVDGFHYSAALFLRFILAFGVLWVLAAWRGVSLRPTAQTRQAWLAGGGCTIVAMVFTYWASQYLNSGVVAVLYGLNPLLTVVFAALLLRQPIQRNEVLGCLLALCGLAVIFADHLAFDSQGLPALLVVLLAVSVNSFGSVALKRYGQGLETLQVSAGSMAVCALVSGGLWLGYGLPLPAEWPLRASAAVLYLALVGSVFALSTYFWLIRECRPTRIALIPMLATVSALWCGHVLNQEALTHEILAGSALIVAGLGLHQLGMWRSR